MRVIPGITCGGLAAGGHLLCGRGRSRGMSRKPSWASAR